MHSVRRSYKKVSSDFGRYLVDVGLISPSALMGATSEARLLNTSVQSCLESRGAISEDDLSVAQAEYLNLPLINPITSPPDPNLSALFDPGLLIRFSVIPWQMSDGKITLLCPSPENYRAFLDHIKTGRTEFKMALAKQSQIIDWLTTCHREVLTQRASSRVPQKHSCRTWERHTNRRRLILTVASLVMFVGFVAFFPAIAFGVFAVWAIFTLMVSALMRTIAYIAEVSAEPDASPPPCPKDCLPRISVLVPLFKEREIASALLRRLNRLTYPKALLDVILVVEENDRLTKAVLEDCVLPPWMRVVDVPEGAPKTKPRAMNYALDFCKGDIVGIWDAEDEPAPDQLQTVADYFHSAGDDLVCLQGVLDYYNSRQNWLARCFTIEYAAWFRLILPGMARLGFAIPLGGTTLFFKRNHLEEIGGWDSHNVTEDADLGFRLARHGYRTDVIPTRTGEEANCRLWPWVRQRSRWLKGYMVTYLVHMRSPRKLLSELGFWRFLGFQAHFVTALSQFILAPILWSFWLVLFGFPHPLEVFVSRDVLFALGLSFLAIELINALINATAVSRPGLRHLFAWVPTMHLYYPLGAIAAYKALYELVVKPFFWDKTEHGISLQSGKFNSAKPSTTMFPSVEFKPGHKSL